MTATTFHGDTESTQTIRALLMVVAVAEGVILAALVIVLFLLSSRVHRQATVTTCQSRYVTALSSALQARAAIGDRAATVTGALQAAVSEDTFKPVALHHAYATYRAAETVLTQERAAHPIPAATDCGA